MTQDVGKRGNGGTNIASYQAVWMTVFSWAKVKEVEDATKRLKVLEII